MLPPQISTTLLITLLLGSTLAAPVPVIDPITGLDVPAAPLAGVQAGPGTLPLPGSGGSSNTMNPTNGQTTKPSGGPPGMPQPAMGGKTLPGQNLALSQGTKPKSAPVVNPGGLPMPPQAGLGGAQMPPPVGVNGGQPQIPPQPLGGGLAGDLGQGGASLDPSLTDPSLMAPPVGPGLGGGGAGMQPVVPAPIPGNGGGSSATGAGMGLGTKPAPILSTGGGKKPVKPNSGALLRTPLPVAGNKRKAVTQPQLPQQNANKAKPAAVRSF